MAIIIGALGILQMTLGVLYVAWAKSAVHETVAALLFGLGTVALALAAILQRLEATRTAPTTPRSSSELITIYRMHDIRRSPLGGVTTAGATFADLEAAKAFIDKRESGLA